ncbi:unnamed protein product [Ceutorhynchus assimilis]|uniref:FP protein C-terminal domain-containing protein n=1 Tax=Ceutorhynchus assimilis TaxID=467358 RepID=A0A9N9MLY8_9CUCU|nr:unnamed protein product [Ceutorhynchus assimilis]
MQENIKTKKGMKKIKTDNDVSQKDTSSEEEWEESGSSGDDIDYLGADIPDLEIHKTDDLKPGNFGEFCGHRQKNCARSYGAWFHKECSGLDNEDFSAYEQRKTVQKWACVRCSIGVGRKSLSGNTDLSGNDEIPIPNSSRRSSIGVHVPVPTPTRRSNNLRVIDEDLDSFESLFDLQNPTNLDMMRVMKRMYNELKNSITFNGSMMEQLKEGIQAISSENSRLKKEHNLLKARIRELERELVHVKSSKRDVPNERNRNIIIVGLKGDENVNADVTNTFKALNIVVPRDEYTVKVLPSKQSKKPVLVSFTDEHMRNNVLKQRKTIQLDTEICNIAADSKTRIYVNPDLSKHTRDLFLKAKELKSHGFKYVWCKDDNILVRKNEEDSAIKIITSAQVDSLKNEL